MDKNEEITEEGSFMASLPLEPQVAKMVVDSRNSGCVKDITTIAAFLSGKNVFLRPDGQKTIADEVHEKFKVRQSDPETLLKVWEEYEKHRGEEEWPQRNYLNEAVLSEVGQVREQLFEILQENGVDLSEGHNSRIIAKHITAGFSTNIMRKDHDSYHPLSKATWTAEIHPSSVLKDKHATLPQHIVATDIFTHGDHTYAGTCLSLTPDEVRKYIPTETVIFDAKAKREKRRRHSQNRKGGKRRS